jgi:hypothetical protein
MAGRPEFGRSHFELTPLDAKVTFHSESDRDAIDHVKIIDGVGTSQELSEWQHVSVCKLRNQADRFRAGDGCLRRK